MSLKKKKSCFALECRVKAMTDEDKTFENLKKCAKCEIVAYCNRECQMADWKHHKDVCKYISEYANAIKDLEDREYERFHRPEEIEIGDFKTQNGCCDFCVLTNAKEYADEPYMKYVNYKMEYLYALWHMAEEYMDYELYEKYFNEASELMRISAKGTADLKYYCAWALINMGRDQEAYNLVKFWMATFDGKMDYSKMREGHGSSYDDQTDYKKLTALANDLKPGEWLHMQPDQDMYENIFDVVKKHQVMDYKHGAFMAALLAIKINIVIKMEASAWKEIEGVKIGMNKEYQAKFKKQCDDLDQYVQTNTFFELEYLMCDQRPTIVSNFSYSAQRNSEERMFVGSSALLARIFWNYFQRLKNMNPRTKRMVTKFLDGKPYYLDPLRPI